MSRRKETITLSLPPGEKAELEKLADFFDCKWGDKPNVSKLLTEIARGNITLVRRGSPITFGDREEFESKVQQLKVIVKYLESI